MSSPPQRRIVRMSRLAEHGYDFSVKTCYEWCALAIDPMPFLDMSKPGAKNTQYFVDLDQLDAWLARRERNVTAAPAPATQAAGRLARRSRQEECAALGLDADHPFA